VSDPKWVRFEALPRFVGRKTDIWQVLEGNGAILGEVRWWGPWRQYTFQPRGGTTYERRCLRDIADFCEEQTTAHRARKAGTA